jgi:hypothetical protein
MSSSRQEQEDLLREDLDKDLVDMKGFMISTEELKVKEDREEIHLEMFLRSLRSSSREGQEVVEAKKASSRLKKAKTLW